MQTLELLDIEATIKSVVYRSQEGYTVLNLTLSESNPLNMPSIIATGHIPYEVKPELSVKLTGHKAQTPYGEQIKIQTFELMIDRTVSGMEKFLGSGMFPGIGPASAKRIVEHFGEETFSILDTEPHRLGEVPKMGEATVAKFIEAWAEHRMQAQSLAPLLDFGLTVNQAKKARELWGREAKRIITSNPYHMILLPGVGFLKADTVALKMGIKPDDPNRIFAGVNHVLTQATQEGHCFLPATELFQQARFLLQIDPNVISRELTGAKNNPAYDDFYFEDGRWYLSEIFEQERAIESIVLKMSQAVDPRFPSIDFPPDSILSPQQQAGILRSLQAGFSIITGLPGTGKTTMVKELLHIARKTIQSVRLAAPTGKAAKRLSEATGYGASTLHRLLGIGPDEMDQGNGNLDDVGLVIVDEVSMMDLRLAYKLLVKINTWKTKVIFIGDFNQLPSVGPGQVLRDLINSEHCPVTKLTKIFRQAQGSPIINLAHAIYKGDTELPEDEIGDNEEMLGTVIKEEIPELMERLCEVVAFEKQAGREVQVLVPFKNKGPLSSQFLNVRLQPIVNPRVNEVLSVSIGKFFMDDRVIQTKNNYDLGVFNGEVGTVAEVNQGEKPTMQVLFDDQKLVTYQKEDLKHLELAYALTIHKSQGSEFDSVILAIHSSHYIMLRRELIYTAITRAKKRLVICTNRKAYKIAVANEQNSERNTTLFKLGGK